MIGKKSISNVAVEAEMMEIAQLGAKIQTINSRTCYIEIDLEKTKVSYIYNVDSKGDFFLKRVLPYPLSIDRFSKEIDIFEIIKRDINQFKNASNSSNIDKFIELNINQNTNIRLLEDLFLYYNVDESDLIEILNLINEIKNKIVSSAKKSQKIYSDTLPYKLKKYIK